MMRGVGHIALRIMAGYMLLLLLLAGVGLFGIRSITDAATATQSLHLHPFTVTNAAGEAWRGMAGINRHILEAMILADDEQRARLAQLVTEIARLVDAEVAIIAQRYLGPKPDITSLETGWNGWKTTAGELVREIGRGDLDDARELYRRKGAADFTTAVHACAPVMAFAQGKARTFVDTSAAARNVLVAIVWQILAATLVLGTAAAVIMTRSFTRPLSALRHAVIGLGQGAFELTIPETARSDEIGDIARTLEVFRRTAIEKQGIELKYRTVFRFCPDIIAISERNTGILIEVNDAFERITGFAKQEVLGRPALDIGIWTRPDGRKQLLDALGDARNMVNVEGELRRKSGQPFVALVSVEAITLSGKACLIVVARDISTRKREEDVLRHAIAELERSNLVLKRFAHAASHDLQEPCRTVCSFAQLLERDYGPALTGSGREYLQFLISGAYRMRSLVQGLLAYSQVGEAAIPFTDVDLAPLLESVLADLDHAITTTGAVITSGTAAGSEPLPVVRGEAAQLHLLFTALINNAIKFQKEGYTPRVTVTAALCNDSWLFRISDNGIGIPAEHIDNVFEAFRRLHGPSQYPGAGIGLALAKRIVETHGGKIWAESQVDVGTTVCFTLPAAETEADQTN